MLWIVTVLSLVWLPILETTMMMMMEGKVGWKQETVAHWSETGKFSAAGEQCFTLEYLHVVEYRVTSDWNTGTYWFTYVVKHAISTSHQMWHHEFLHHVIFQLFDTP